MMFSWFELLKYLVPVMAIAIPLLILVYWFLKNNLKLRQIELAKQMRSELIPTRLQAYERIALLLERITPESMIIREQKQGVSSIEFHQYLLKAIRNEFEHNLAMQIYLPQKTWDAVIAAREEVVKLINSSSGTVQPNSPSMELARHLLEKSAMDKNFYIRQAKKQLKEDIQLFYFNE